VDIVISAYRSDNFM